MARTVVIPVDTAALLAGIQGAMLASGWTDDGAPASTILASAADSEGRQAFIKLEEETVPDRVKMTLGNGRTGDTITSPGTIVNIGASILWDDKTFLVYTSDRWICVDKIAEVADLDFALLGILETPMAIGDYLSPLIASWKYHISGAADTTPILMRTSDSRIYLPNDATAPSVFTNCASALLSFWESGTIGLEGMGRTSKEFFRGRGTRGPAWPCYRWWPFPYNDYLVGYLKEAYMVAGTHDDNTKGARQSVQIGSHRYHSIGTLRNHLGILGFGTTEEGFDVMFRGDAIS